MKHRKAKSDDLQKKSEDLALKSDPLGVQIASEQPIEIDKAQCQAENGTSEENKQGQNEDKLQVEQPPNIAISKQKLERNEEQKQSSEISEEETKVCSNLGSKNSKTDDKVAKNESKQGSNKNNGPFEVFDTIIGKKSEKERLFKSEKGGKSSEKEAVLSIEKKGLAKQKQWKNPKRHGSIEETEVDETQFTEVGEEQVPSSVPGKQKYCYIIISTKL